MKLIEDKEYREEFGRLIEEYTKEELAAIGTEINGEYVITDPTLSYEEKRKLIEII